MLNAFGRSGLQSVFGSVRNGALLGLCFLLIVSAARGADDESGGASTHLTDLSLEELARTRVTTVSKRPEALDKTAAAITVITQEEIRRSGASSIPDLLRTVPGLNVAQFTTEVWAISPRGLNGLNANKTLVMIDGRTLYGPMGSTTFWAEHDLILEDIDRIEVIRGPGGTTWGANAVNGVINIITKKVMDTQGDLVVVEAGNDAAIGSVRHGAVVNEDLSYRVFGKAFWRDAIGKGDTPAEPSDNYMSMQLGARIDWTPTPDDSLSFQGGLHYTESEGTVRLITLDPPTSYFDEAVAMATEVYTQGEWIRELDADREVALRYYHNHVERDYVRSESTYDIFDLDTIYRTREFGNHALSLGCGYRGTVYDMDNTDQHAIDPSSDDRHMASAFLEDQVSFLDDRLLLTAGSKFEHNESTGLEVMPSVRALVSPCEGHALWAAVSRAVRVPGVADDSLRTLDVSTGRDGSATITMHRNTDDFESESVLAYELGYRAQLCPSFWVDIATFYNRYDDLGTWVTEDGQGRIDLIFADVETALSGETELKVIDRTNDMKGETGGAELAVRWQAMPQWLLRLSYSYLDMDFELKGDSTAYRSLAFAEGTSPQHQASLVSYMDISRSLELDAWIYYVDELVGRRTDSYVTGGLRLGMQLNEDVELSFIGENILFDQAHSEFELFEVEESYRVKLTWYFM